MYVVILAKSHQEGTTYARRAKLPRGRYRVATSARVIRRLRVAEIHELPSFAKRIDRHAINAELRWTRGERILVEMPPADNRLSLEDALEVAYDENERRDLADRFIAALEDEIVSSDQIDTEVARGKKTRAAKPREDAAPAPKARKPASVKQSEFF